MGKQWKQWQTLFWGAPKSLQMVTAAMKLKDTCSLEEKRWHPTLVLLPGKSYGWRSLVGCSLWGRTESDTTEQFHFHFSLSCIGEGNGNPLQCSCLENPRDGGAWWAAIYEVAKSWTRLKQLSSSSSMYQIKTIPWNNRLVPNRERSTSRVDIVTMVI